MRLFPLAFSFSVLSSASPTCPSVSVPRCQPQHESTFPSYPTLFPRMKVSFPFRQLLKPNWSGAKEADLFSAQFSNGRDVCLRALFVRAFPVDFYFKV